MKTKALITILALALFAAPLTYAGAGESDEEYGTGGGTEDTDQSKEEKEAKGGKGEVKGTTTDCSKLSLWRNHGEYVSCVARLHLGGAVTSEAARSDIGKKVESAKVATVSAEKKVKEKKENKRFFGIFKKADKDTKEATGSAKFKGDRKETLIYKLESLIERLTHLLDFLKSK